MPQGSDYIFCIQDKDFRFWKIVDNKVTISAQPYFLEFAPAGWLDITVQNVRNRKYWGIDRSVTIPFNYVEDGARIIKYIFLNKGIEEPVYITILQQQLDYEPGVGYAFWYRQQYRGEIDLTTYSHEGSAVKVTTLEDGLPKYLKANENTTIELPMSVPEAINVKMDGIKLLENAHYRDIDAVEFSGVSVGSDGFTPTLFIAAEGDHVGVDLSSQFLENISGASWDDKINSNNLLVQNFNSTPLVVTISGRTEITGVNNTSPAWAFRRRFIKTGQLIGDQNIYQVFSSGFSAGVTVGQDFSITVTLNQNEKLHSEGVFFGGISGNPSIVFTENSKFDISFISRGETTYIKSLRGQYLFEKFINFMTEGNFTASNSAFLNTNRQIVFTCGNAIRGFTDAVMKWNFADFFQFWDCFSSVGIDANGTQVTLSEKKDIDDATYIDLPEPSNLKVSVDGDFLYNELAIGYPEIKNDIGVLNGNEEFNCGFLFSMGVMKKPARLDKVSKTSASCYAIEKIRITTVNKDTTDYKLDNDVFAVAIDDTLVPESGAIPAHYSLDRSLNASSTGLIEKDSVFNLPLSPHLNFKRNGPELRSRLWKCDYKTLKYQSSDKNNKLTFTDPVYGPIVEKADENIGGLGTRFFTPVVFDIEVPVDYNTTSLLEIVPRKKVRFPFYGDTYTGIYMKAQSGLASNKSQQWIILASPDTDVTKLEDYYGG